MYAKAGYAVPQIIFWNLRDCDNVPVEKDTPGTALVSGFSANMMKTFLEAKFADIKFDPMEAMLYALEKYTIDPIPEDERKPFPSSFGWKDRVEGFDEIVKDYVVPKMIPRKRKAADADVGNASDKD